MYWSDLYSNSNKDSYISSRSNYHMKKYTIHRSDDSNTRHSKKNAKNKVLRKAKLYHQSVKIIPVSKKGKFHKTSRNKVKFSLYLEKFCSQNLSVSRFSKPFHGLVSKSMVLKLNEDFSLFTNPTKVLTTLVDLLYHAKIIQASPRVIYENHVSFGAIYLLDNLSWEIAKKRKWVLQMKNFPEQELSILSNIKSFVSSTYDDDNETMINEKVVISRDNPGDNQQYKAKAKDITDMLEKAIREITKNELFQLTHEAHGAIKSTIGESFDNIHLHSEEADFGTLCGFYNKMTKEITLLIYNFGITIPESFFKADIPKEIADAIEEVIAIHTKKNYINFMFGGEFTAENALTLLAIQEGISTRIKYDESRGHGIIDFIEHCLSLNSNSKIVIISGKTAIKIDSTYPISQQNVMGRSRRIIALNKDNDIYNKPDKNFVINTGVHFNGVLIEATIPLDNVGNGN